MKKSPSTEQVPPLQDSMVHGVSSHLSPSWPVGQAHLKGQFTINKGKWQVLTVKESPSTEQVPPLQGCSVHGVSSHLVPSWPVGQSHLKGQLTR